MLPATYLGAGACDAAVRAVGVRVGASARRRQGGAGASRSCATSTADADAVIAYGEHVRRYVRAYRGRDDDRVRAPQSVEADLFGRARSARRDRRLARRGTACRTARSCCIVGRLVPEKGIAVLLAAWRDGCAPGRGATVAVIGDGPLAAEVRAAPGVRLLGPLARERLPVAYAAGALVVVPSIPTPRFLEPWGLVCNEAMHQATPVIATTAVGAAAGGLVRDGETGLVVAPGDPAGLAAAIDRLLADAPLRARLGEAGRAALAGHTYAAMADAFGRRSNAPACAEPALGPIPVGPRPEVTVPRRRRSAGTATRLAVISKEVLLPDREQRLEVVLREDLEGDHVCVRATPGSCAICPVITCASSLLLAQAQDRDEVPLAGDRVRLGDARRRRPARRRASASASRSAWIRTIAWVMSSQRLPRREHDDLRAGRASTSALNACASVSIGGNVL